MAGSTHTGHAKEGHMGLTALVIGRGLVESPRWHGERLYFSDWTAGEVLAVGLGGTARQRTADVVARVDSMPLCTACLPDGRLVIVDSAGGKLLRLERGGSLGPHAEPGPSGWDDIVNDG